MDRSRTSALSHVLASGLLVVLGACGGGADTVQNPAGPGGAPATYTGPPPATADVQAFKINVWDNLKATNRCGQCHVGGGQTPQFVRQDDVNLAYEAANTVVTLSSPEDSMMVTKVAGGHNCWLASNDACGEILTTWISNWAGDIAAGGGGVVLEAPPLRDPGASKSFPTGAEGSALYASTVYPIVEEYCQRCHAPSAANAQSPYFASEDIPEAYGAARTKINLDQPALSRLVVRLRNEFHNCWSDCAANANTMQAAIQAFANQVELTQVDASLVLSKALSLYEGTVASGGNRYNGNVIGMWEFKTGSGTVAYDTSGVEPAIDLTLSGDVTWVGGWGINVRSGKAQGSTTTSKKLHDLIKATGEYTIEAWVAPGNVAQEESRIVSYSGGVMARNFMLGQTLYSYDFHNRSSSSNQNGDPKLMTSADDEDLQATLQHVVATYDPVNGRRIYVNGEFTEDADPVAGGTLGDWDDTFALVLGNEVSGDRQFQGVFRMVAIFNRAITPAQITQNFQAGVGEKFYLLFSVSHLVDMPQAYVMFEVSQLDSYGYLFDKPTFISLDAAATAGQHPGGRHPHRRQWRGGGGRAGVSHTRYGRRRFQLRAGWTAPVRDRNRHRAREGSGVRRVLPDLRRARRPHQRAYRPDSARTRTAARCAAFRGHRHASVRRAQRDDVRAHRHQHAEPGCRFRPTTRSSRACRRSRPSTPSCRRTRSPWRSSRSSTATRWWRTSASAPRTSRASTSMPRRQPPWVPQAAQVARSCSTRWSAGWSTRHSRPTRSWATSAASSTRSSRVSRRAKPRRRAHRP